MKPYERTKLYDIAIAGPWIIFYIWSVSTLLDDEVRLWSLAVSGKPRAVVELLNVSVSIVFMTLIVCLVPIRRMPVAKAPGYFPRLTAAMGTTGSLSFPLIPRADLSVIVEISATMLLFVGTLGAAITLMWLGR